MSLNCGVGEDSWGSLGLQGNQSILKEINWIFIGRTDAEAEVSIVWPPDAKKQFVGKDPDSGNHWRQEVTEKRWLDGITNSMDRSLSKLWGIVKDTGLVCCGLWGDKESNMTEQLRCSTPQHKWGAQQQQGESRMCAYWGRGWLWWRWLNGETLKAW